MVAEQIEESPEGGGEGLSPALIRQLARALILSEADAEEHAALAKTARRLIPWRLAHRDQGVMTLTPELLAYLEALPLDHSLLVGLRARDRRLSDLFVAYLVLIRDDVPAGEAVARLAADRGCSAVWIRKLLEKAQALAEGYAGAVLSASIRRRQAEPGGGNLRLGRNQNGRADD